MHDISAPFISIIVPTRNRVELLSRALRAIKTQTFHNFEVIVIDDGSGNESRLKYSDLWNVLDSRFLLHTAGDCCTGKGLGPSATRNAGIALARGEIIAFCDDDDFWTADNHLEAMAAIYAAHPQVDMYIANQQGVSSRGIEIADWFPKLTAAIAARSGQPTPGGLVSVSDLCKAGGFAHLNVLSVRKRIAVEVGGFWERVSYEEDRDFFWRSLDRCNKVFYSPRVVAQHNIPDPKKKDNQSTQHAVIERWLLAVLVCQHIATTVRHSAISGLARNYEGDLLRKVATYFAHAGQHTQSFAFGSRALAARFSLKWTAYLVLLAFKSLITKETK